MSHRERRMTQLLRILTSQQVVSTPFIGQNIFYWHFPPCFDHFSIILICKGETLDHSSHTDSVEASN